LEVDPNYDDKTVVISGNNNYVAYNLNIPSKIRVNSKQTGNDIFNVVSIGDGVFDAANITGKLTIPNTITYIGNDCFYGVKISDISIKNNAVYGLASNVGAAKIVVKKTGSSSILDYSKQDLVGCLAVGILTIPNVENVIGDSAFWGCASLTAVNFSNSLTSIGNNAFVGCSSLSGTLTIPATVQTIGYDAFEGCSSFTGTLTIPATVQTIGYDAFDSCSGISELNLESFTGTYGSTFLKACTSLQTVYISASTTATKTADEG
jgi:hypothetical protein